MGRWGLAPLYTPSPPGRRGRAFGRRKYKEDRESRRALCGELKGKGGCSQGRCPLRPRVIPRVRLEGPRRQRAPAALGTPWALGSNKAASRRAIILSTASLTLGTGSSFRVQWCRTRAAQWAAIERRRAAGVIRVFICSRCAALRIPRLDLTVPSAKSDAWGRVLNYPASAGRSCSDSPNAFGPPLPPFRHSFGWSLLPSASNSSNDSGSLSHRVLHWYSVSFPSSPFPSCIDSRIVCTA